MINAIGKLKKQSPRFDHRKPLGDLISVCSCCEKIQDGEKSWRRPADNQVTTNSEAALTHGLCPVCYEEQRAAFRKLRLRPNF